jgi:hypothetical protein
MCNVPLRPIADVEEVMKNFQVQVLLIVFHSNGILLNPFILVIN